MYGVSMRRFRLENGRASFPWLCVYIYNRKLLKKLRYTVAKSAVQARDGLSTTLWHVRRANTLDATIFKYC